MQALPTLFQTYSATHPRHGNGGVHHAIRRSALGIAVLGALLSLPGIAADNPPSAASAEPGTRVESGVSQDASDAHAAADRKTSVTDAEYFAALAAQPDMLALQGGAYGHRTHAGEGPEARSAELVVLNLSSRPLRAAPAEANGELTQRMRKGQRYTMQQLPAELSDAVRRMHVGDVWEVFVPARTPGKGREGHLHDAQTQARPHGMPASVFEIELLAAH